MNEVPARFGGAAPDALPAQMHAFLAELFPICRSITGNGVRRTLDLIGQQVPLTVHEIPSGTQAFDWTVPREWNIRDAYVEDAQGNRLVDFKDNNLHVVGYSTPIDRWVDRAELEAHLHSLPEQPNAIPYVTSYYAETWGFCVSHDQRVRLDGDSFHVVIDADLEDGNLTYGECIIPGAGEREVFISTYVCHPSMANNELSGPVVATFLAKFLASAPRRYTYRIVFVPETIGAIVYLSRNVDALKANVDAGFNLSCLGDERGYSFVASRYGSTLADRIARNVLSFGAGGFTEYSFLERGSDERQYCAPGVDLPLAGLCRSKYATYPEYHTSLDNLDLVTPEGLRGGYEIAAACVLAAEANATYRTTVLGEPQLGKRGLYPNLSRRDSSLSIQPMMDLLAYADGTNDLIAISDRIGVPIWDLGPIADELRTHGLLEAIPAADR